MECILANCNGKCYVIKNKKMLAMQTLGCGKDAISGGNEIKHIQLTDIFEDIIQY